MKDGKRHGKGFLMFSDESLFEGLFYNDKPHGYGLIIYI